MSHIDGLLVLDKPAGCTSHDVVARCRRIFGQKRVGHAGTLDPDATGVLLVGLGQATRLLQYLSGLSKRYTGEVVLGVATTTLDAMGTVTGTWDMSAVNLEAARTAARSLTGQINQVPPMVSALKVGGRRLHELARAGIEVERAARPVTVWRFDIELAPVAQIDEGTALGGGAHLRSLRRLAVGSYGVDEAVSLDALEASPEPAKAVLGPVEALRGMARLTVSGDVAEAVGHGRVLPLGAFGDMGREQPGPWAVLSGAGSLLAVYQAHGPQHAKPSVVLSFPAGAGG